MSATRAFETMSSVPELRPTSTIATKKAIGAAVTPVSTMVAPSRTADTGSDRAARRRSNWGASQSVRTSPAGAPRSASPKVASSAPIWTLSTGRSAAKLPKTSPMATKPRAGRAVMRRAETTVMARCATARCAPQDGTRAPAEQTRVASFLPDRSRLYARLHRGRRPWRRPLQIWRIAMAGAIPDLIAEPRAGTGKGAARQARREGKVPGIVYGGGADPLPIQIPFNQLVKRLKDGRFLSTLFNLKVEGQEDVRVICRGVQRDVVKDLPTHVDLMRLRRTSKVNLFIPVEFVNQEEAPGLKRGGVLTVVRPEVELIVVAGDIPDHITSDLSGRNIGDVVHISDIPLPEGVKPTIDRDFVIANITAPSGLVSSDNAEAAEAEGEEAEG